MPCSIFHPNPTDPTVKTHLLLKIVPALLLLGTTAFAQSGRFITDRNGNIFEAPTVPQTTLPPPVGAQEAPKRSYGPAQQPVERIVAEARKSSSRIAQLTAEYAVANPKSAAEVIAGVERATGIRGDYLAAAIGREFEKNPALAAEAPSIAKALVNAILAKGSALQFHGEIAETVAILVTSLPGKSQANQQAIAQVGREVASVLSASHPEIAAEVVGITASVIKTTSGSSDVSKVISGFADAFKTDNSNLNTKLDSIVTNVNSGQVYNALPTSSNVINNATGNTTTTSGLSAGSVTTPETKNQNG